MFALRSPLVCGISFLFSFLSLLSIAHAQATTSCVYTTTTTTSVLKTTTTYTSSTTVSSEFFSVNKVIASTIFVTQSTTFTSRAPRRTSTIILDQGTRTLGGYEYTTKSCPAGPKYVLACSKFSSTEPWTYTSTTYTSTTTISAVWTSTRFIPRTTTVITKKVKTGSPPTTVTVTSTSTQNTYYRTTTVTKYKTLASTTVTDQPTTVVGTSTYTTSLASPTATATLNLFSLQITNTSNYVDGYTWGQRGPVTGSTVVIQNKSVWRYYIDPASQFLVHAPSGNYLGWVECSGEECLESLVFVPDVPETGGGSRTQRLKCNVGCGRLLECWFADESQGRQYVTFVLFDTVLGAQIGLSRGVGGLVPNLRAVGPTKGR